MLVYNLDNTNLNQEEKTMSSLMSLANQLLIAVPSLTESEFNHSVIYVCEHHTAGTVGLMINRPMPYSLNLVFDQLHLESKSDEKKRPPLLFGGPLQKERGFVIHRPFGEWRSSLSLNDDVTITTSNDIIRAIAEDSGPKDLLVVLGFVSWDQHQLEQEVINNSWLVCPFTPEILYDVPFKDRWNEAGLAMGVNMKRLTSNVGHG